MNTGKQVCNIIGKKVRAYVAVNDTEKKKFDGVKKINNIWIEISYVAVNDTKKRKLDGVKKINDIWMERC